MDRPEVCFFDLGDTLMSAHPSWAGVYLQGLREFGIDVGEAELADALAAATREGDWRIDSPFEATEAASYERIKRFDERVLARLGHAGLPDGLFRAIEAAFMRRSAWFLFPDVVPAVEALRAAGVRLGVISNWVWGGPELLHDMRLAHHFESVVISARVGYQKPDPGIFEYALREMRVTPEKAVHVGDNYVADVQGARCVGITPVLIDRRLDDMARLRDEHADPQLAVVSDLYALLELLSVERPAAAPVR